MMMDAFFKMYWRGLSKKEQDEIRKFIEKGNDKTIGFPVMDSFDPDLTIYESLKQSKGQYILDIPDEEKFEDFRIKTNKEEINFINPILKEKKPFLNPEYKKISQEEIPKLGRNLTKSIIYQEAMSMYQHGFHLVPGEHVDVFPGKEKADSLKGYDIWSVLKNNLTPVLMKAVVAVKDRTDEETIDTLLKSGEGQDIRKDKPFGSFYSKEVLQYWSNSKMLYSSLDKHSELIAETRKKVFRAMRSPDFDHQVVVDLLVKNKLPWMAVKYSSEIGGVAHDSVKETVLTDILRKTGTYGVGPDSNSLVGARPEHFARLALEYGITEDRQKELIESEFDRIKHNANYAPQQILDFKNDFGMKYSVKDAEQYFVNRTNKSNGIFELLEYQQTFDLSDDFVMKQTEKALKLEMYHGNPLKIVKATGMDPNVALELMKDESKQEWDRVWDQSQQQGYTGTVTVSSILKNYREIIRYRSALPKSKS